MVAYGYPNKTQECVTGHRQQTTNYFIVRTQKKSSGNPAIPEAQRVAGS